MAGSGVLVECEITDEGDSHSYDYRVCVLKAFDLGEVNVIVLPKLSLLAQWDCSLTSIFRAREVDGKTTVKDIITHLQIIKIRSNDHHSSM